VAPDARREAARLRCPVPEGAKGDAPVQVPSRSRRDGGEASAWAGELNNSILELIY
jgi:hypothetical protein